MTNKIKTLDSLDLFLNKAHWSYKKYKSFNEIRSRVLIEILLRYLIQKILQTDDSKK